MNKFGTTKTDKKIYNRFFRTVIHYGLKSFFPNQKVVINNVYHDKGNVEDYKFFRHLNLSKLENESRKPIYFKNKEIIFIDSNHRTYEINSNEYNVSNIIQFADLILGSISQCIYYLSNDKLKKECASIIYSLVKNLTQDFNYTYFKKQ